MVQLVLKRSTSATPEIDSRHEIEWKYWCYLTTPSLTFGVEMVVHDFVTGLEMKGFITTPSLTTGVEMKVF